jgi:5-methyltetrahydropteroyltriglutamate--homocysteine methyltransferase
MSARATPPFRADQVGSLIRPQALIDAREAAQQGRLPQAELLKIQHDAISEVVRKQEEIGLKVVTDGEFNRFSWQRDFLLKIKNVAPAEAKLNVRFHSKEGARDHKPPTLEVRGKISRPGPMFVGDFEYLASIAKATPKVTMPSPTILHFRGGRSSVDQAAYPDMDGFFADLSQVYREELSDLYAKGCRYAQIDEVNLAYLCDPVLRSQAVSFGEDPDKLPATYARLINESIAGLPADMTICMHLCRGNFAGAWIAEGGYEPVADLLFNQVNVTGYFLEFDSERAGGFEPLRFLPKGKVAVLGLATTKNSAMETKDALKRRIEEAAKYAPLDQLALSAQCGFSSGIGGETMTVERQFEKLALIVETAREVWGSA